MADYPLFEPAQPAGPSPAPDPKAERARKASLVLKVSLVLGVPLGVIISWGFMVRRERLEAEQSYQESLRNPEKRVPEGQVLLDAREVERLGIEVAETRALLAAAPWTRGRPGDLASLESALARVEDLVRAHRYEEADRLLDEVRLAVPAGPAPSGPVSPDESSFLPVMPGPETTPAPETAPAPKSPKKKRIRKRSRSPSAAGIQPA